MPVKLKSKVKPLALVIAGGFLSIDSISVYAQALEEVIVSARKREESLQDVPVVVQAFSGDALAANGTTTFDDLSDQVSGMTLYSQGPVQPSIAIRGIQGDAINTGGDEPVSVNVDGIPHSSSQIFRYGVFDVESVEVLKGPQALFFGKNSPGGIIVMKTQNPTDELFTEFQVGYEEAGERAYGHGIVSGPITDVLGGRLSIRSQTADGLFTNTWGEGDPTRDQPADRTGPDFDEIVAIGTLQLSLDNLESTLKYYYADRDGGAYNFNQAISCDNPNYQGQVNPFTDCTLDDQLAAAPYFALPFSPLDPTAPGFPFNQTSRYGSSEHFFSYEMEQLSWDLSFDINDTWSFNNIFGYVNQHNESFGNLGGGGDASLLAGFGVSLAVALDIKVEQYTEEFRFEGEFDNFNVMFGAFFDDRSVESAQPLFATLGAGIPVLALQPDIITIVDGNASSVFGQVEWIITETVDLSVGARYTEETREMSGRSLGGIILPAGTLVPAAPLLLNVDELKYDNLSPEVTLSWQPTSDLNVFASYKEGFKSGGFNSVPNNSTRLALPNTVAEGLPEGDPGIVDDEGLDFLEENVDGFELGFKWELFDNTLRVNGTAFSYEYTDLQQPQRSDVDGEIVTRTVNAGVSYTDGLELDILWQTPFEPLRLSANLAYLDSEYGDWIAECSQDQIFLDAPGCTVDLDNNPATSAVQGTPVSFNQAVIDAGAEAQDRSGDPLRNAPEFSGSLGAMFDTEISDALGFKANLNAYYSGAYQADARGDRRGYQESFWTFGANLGLYATDDSWALDLIVRNLTDESYLVSAYTPNGAQGPASMLGVVNSPREIALQFTIRPSALF